jgi:Tfp pilus assembly protein PilV
MNGPTCTFWANLTPSSLQLRRALLPHAEALAAAVAAPQGQQGADPALRLHQLELLAAMLSHDAQSAARVLGCLDAAFWRALLAWAVARPSHNVLHGHLYQVSSVQFGAVQCSLERFRTAGPRSEPLQTATSTSSSTPCAAPSTPAACVRCSATATCPARCRFVPPLIHFMPDSLIYSMPLFLKRQCDLPGQLAATWAKPRHASMRGHLLLLANTLRLAADGGASPCYAAELLRAHHGWQVRKALGCL